MDYVAGYVVVNDVTVVEWMRDASSPSLGKSFPGHGRLGPWLVTVDEVVDPYTLALGCWIDGIQVQSGSTAAMRVGIAEMIAYLSVRVRLEPGDVLATGSPMRAEGRLEAGTRVRCTIEGIGALDNPVLSISAS